MKTLYNELLFSRMKNFPSNRKMTEKKFPFQNVLKRVKNCFVPTIRKLILILNFCKILFFKQFFSIKQINRVVSYHQTFIEVACQRLAIGARKQPKHFCHED